MTEGNQSPARDVEPDLFPVRKRSSFRRRLWWSVPLGLGIGVAFSLTFLRDYRPWYQASAVLAVNADSGALRPPGGLTRGVRHVILSDAISEAVLSHPTIANSPMLSDPETAKENLAMYLSVDPGDDGSVMSLRFIDYDRTASAAVCNLIAEEYLERCIQFDRKRFSTLKQLLESEITLLKERLEEQQQRVVDLSRESPEPSAKLQFATDDLERTQVLLAKLTDRMAQVHAEAKSGNSVQLVSRAVAPPHPLNGFPTNKIVTAMTIGLIIPQLMGLAWGTRRRPIW
ncbi:hypothetical protein Mal15_04660 [Stieleria maiorica]|uniref:Chain length determinant protein n=1 Tax=Stieleria maiorica TaxID=2795974 RepID=A0A5B9M5F7_9BACT|nr:hypothetical protein [Stieleria maiorica]QEF96438.1 hypothetical protein Mal15_04660 [Stieleria maiorica]